jgi:hypothetical protein
LTADVLGSVLATETLLSLNLAELGKDNANGLGHYGTRVLRSFCPSLRRNPLKIGCLCSIVNIELGSSSEPRRDRFADFKSARFEGTIDGASLLPIVSGSACSRLLNFIRLCRRGLCPVRGVLPLVIFTTCLCAAEVATGTTTCGTGATRADLVVAISRPEISSIGYRYPAKPRFCVAAHLAYCYAVAPSRCQMVATLETMRVAIACSYGRAGQNSNLDEGSLPCSSLKTKARNTHRCSRR